jgi:GNAT superfamily N-acetyltransferase
MILVRVLEEADVAKLVAAFPEPTRPVNRHIERFALQQSGDITCLAAWDADRPIGYVFARWPGCNGGLTAQAITLGCVELGDLFVAEDARGSGAGRALMEAAEALVAARGYALVGGEVTVANPHTDVARGLYERMGYRDAGLGEFVSGYTYWDANGAQHRDEERYRYITKRLR